jgi:hypothetical protein
LNVDPGSIIEKEELGEITHGNLNRLLEEMDNISNTNDFARRAKAYVERTHVLNTAKIKEVSYLFCEINKNGSEKN